MVMASVSENSDIDRDALAKAIGLYALGEINEGKAAELAGIDRWTMREVLQEAGLDLRLGPATPAEARREVAGLYEEDENRETDGAE